MDFEVIGASDDFGSSLLLERPGLSENAIRWLVAQGKISPEEGKKTASRIAEKLGVSLLAV